MSTLLKIRRDGVPMHSHPTTRNPEGRWHSGWERHPGDENAHVREDAAHPSFVRSGFTWTWENALARNIITQDQINIYYRSLNGTNLDVLLNTNRANRGRVTRSTAVLGVVEGDLEIAIDNRRFGVEMECITNTAEVMQRLRTLGINAEMARYNHETPRGFWKFTSDGSLSYGGGRPGFHTIEIVSPILQGTAGLQELKKVCGVLNDVGTMVNRTWGMHVHHDANGLDVETAKRLARNYFNSQRAIDRLLAPSRRSSEDPQYCHPWTEDEVRQIEHSATIGEMSRSNRYRGLNIGPAYTRHHTFEFRQHQGTVDFSKIAAWIKLGQKMIDVSVKGITLEANQSLVWFLEKTELPDYLVTFFQARATALTNGGS